MAPPRDEEYYKRYINLFNLIRQAYLDEYFLNSIENFKDDLPHEINWDVHSYVFVVSHICELVKRDLALTLWKIFYDDNGKANTLKGLKKYLFTQYQKQIKYKETANIRNIRTQISAARNSFIAHNTLANTTLSLQCVDLINALHDIRLFFNMLCLPDIDSRVKPISETQIYNISFQEKFGFERMLKNALQQRKDVPQEDTDA